MYITIIVLSTSYAIIKLLQIYGVFETSRGVRTVSKDFKWGKKRGRRLWLERTKLQFYTNLVELFPGVFLPSHVVEQYQYFIDRLHYRSVKLNRSLTVEELRGKHAIWLYIGFSLVPFGLLVSKIFLVLSIGCVLVYIYKPIACQRKIDREDYLIDTYFIDFYLLLYSKLRLGSSARIQPVVKAYVEVLRTLGDSEMQRVMYKMAEYLLNLLSMLPDDKAVMGLRDRYKSSTIFNFCNIASQALQGIDNSDTLLSFRMELVQRKKQQMSKKAKALALRADKSLYIMYIELFALMLLFFYSKLPVGFF